MKSKVATVPIPSPNPIQGLSPSIAVAGLPIPPIERIKIFSSEQWEDFVLEYVDYLRTEYADVNRCGGAGDMGRDVIAICKDTNSGWHNYQCKHYKNPLMPSDVWIEIGKLIYYTFSGEFACPSSYYFVAPQGAGTSLSNLLKKPDEIRNGLIREWDKHCKAKITSTAEIGLDKNLLAYITSFDFSIFEAIPPLRILDGHGKTRWHVARFGGCLPARGPVATPPGVPAPSEANYVKQLLSAYSDHSKQEILTHDDLASLTDLREHFDDSRLEFYSAESLRTLSRDHLPPGEFEKLQDEIHSGVKDDIRKTYDDGYIRLLAVVKTARCLGLTSNILLERLSVRDRGGICHQLANDNKIRWVK